MRIPVIWCLALAARALPGASGALDYSTFLGGDGADVIHAMAIDASNNIYLTGETRSSNFPVTPGAFQQKSAANPGTMTGLLGPPATPNAFVVKLNPAGQIVYATYLGGSGGEIGLGIAVDSTGSAYVVGTTLSQNFPVTAGVVQPKFGGDIDSFVAKLSPDGSKLIYSTYLGGSDVDAISAIAIDGSDNVYLGGASFSSDFPTTPGAYLTKGLGAFAAKLNATATALVYATFLGDDGQGGVTGIAIDSGGNAYAGGTTSALNFPTTPGAIHGVLTAENSAAFLVKLNPAGSAAVYSAVLAGAGSSGGGPVAVDSLGDAYFAGGTNAPDFPVTSGAVLKSTDYSHVFVVKLNPAGSALVYGTFLGGSGNDLVSGLAIDSSGSAFISGMTYSTDFPVTPDALPKRFAGSPCLFTSGSPFGENPLIEPCGDAFAAKLDAAGSTLVYSTYLSGSNAESAAAAAIDSNGAMYVAGWTQSNNFPIAGTPVADTRYPATCVDAGSPSSSQSDPCADGFVARINFSGTSTPPALRVVNFGSLLETPVAPSEIVTLFGKAIGPDSPALLQLDSSNRIATVLSNTRVLFDGVASPLIRVDSDQITAIVPEAVAGKSHSQITVERSGITTASARVVVDVAAPALLTVDPSGAGPCAAINPDGTRNSPASPAPAGSIVSLFMLGAGATGQADGALAAEASNVSPAPMVVVSTGFVPFAEVLYAGPSPGSTVALMQINIQLPSGVSGQVPVFVLYNGLGSQYGATIFVK